MVLLESSTLQTRPTRRWPRVCPHYGGAPRSAAQRLRSYTKRISKYFEIDCSSKGPVARRRMVRRPRHKQRFGHAFLAPVGRQAADSRQQPPPQPQRPVVPTSPPCPLPQQSVAHSPQHHHDSWTTMSFSSNQSSSPNNDNAANSF